jgi:predicted GNAT superfamily acetyltransferase
MGPVIRAVDIADLATFRTLNDAAVPAVNRIPLSTFDWFRVHAPYFRAAVEDDTTLAFLIALTPGLDYDSPNYRWFEHRGTRFVYIDRIVVAPPARGRGVARMLYQDLAAFAAPFADALTCEVNLRPPNPGSVAFHQRMGFREVGRQETEGGAKEVVLMERGL